MARPIGLQMLQHLSQSTEIQVCLPSWELGRTSQAVIKWVVRFVANHVNIV